MKTGERDRRLETREGKSTRSRRTGWELRQTQVTKKTNRAQIDWKKRKMSWRRGERHAVGRGEENRGEKRRQKRREAKLYRFVPKASRSATKMEESYRRWRKPKGRRTKYCAVMRDVSDWRKERTRWRKKLAGWSRRVSEWPPCWSEVYIHPDNGQNLSYEKPDRLSFFTSILVPGCRLKSFDAPFKFRSLSLLLPTMHRHLFSESFRQNQSTRQLSHLTWIWVSSLRFVKQDYLLEVKIHLFVLVYLLQEDAGDWLDHLLSRFFLLFSLWLLCSSRWGVRTPQLFFPLSGRERDVMFPIPSFGEGMFFVRVLLLPLAIENP